MYQFHSSVKSKDLHSKYIKEFKHIKSYTKRFDKLLSDNPDLKRSLPEGITYSRLLTMPFDKLADIYFDYQSFAESLTKAEKESLNKDIAAIFNYNSHKGKIRNFIADPENGFEIYNCIYCDIEPVEGYTRGNGTRNLKFHVEHILDKGKCPLLALSLHNFLPACPTCNEEPLKGTRTLGHGKEETIRLSPTHNKNDFEHKVRFIISIDDKDLKDLIMWEDLNAWSIDFEVDENIYYRTIEMFDLKERYNAPTQKREFGRFLAKRQTNPDNLIWERAEMRRVTFDRIKEDLFEFEYRKRHHYPMEKCRRELLSDYDNLKTRH